MGYFIDKNNAYYEGDRVEDDLEVPQRPAPNYAYQDGVWILIPPIPPTTLQLLAATDQYMSRASEDLIVCLLSKSVITKADYPQIVWDRINYRRSLRNQPPI